MQLQSECDPCNRTRLKGSVETSQNFNRPADCIMDATQSLDEAGTTPPLVGTVVVEGANKWVTKKYADGRSLTMSLVDGEIVDKHLTYKVTWDLEALKAEQEKGADGVSFKYWEKRGLSVLKSFYGTYLVGLMFTLDYTKVTHPKIKCEKVEDELEYDIDFPMVDVRKLTMEDGYSADQKGNPKLGSIMHRRIVAALLKFEGEKQSEDGAEFVGRKRKAEEDGIQCDICGETPCVWSSERDTVVARDVMEHGHTCTVVNSTRRKTAYRHMFIVTNGGYGQKGVRKRLPECVEKGVRALFPDAVHMGFKEE